MGKIIKNSQGGFIKTLIIIIVLVLILAYFNVSLKGVVAWIVSAFKSVF